MIKYIRGCIINILNFRISLFSLIDHESMVDKKAKIYRKTKIFRSKIDSYTYVAPNTTIICTDIGKFCSIAEHCSIGLAKHSLRNISTSPIFTSHNNALNIKWTTKQSFEEYSRTVIGNDVWIGARVIIMGGVKIGNGAVIGAGSIVTKDVPDYAIVVGVPARTIKYRFNQPLINKLIEIGWWDKSDDELKKAIAIFQKEDIDIDELNNI